MKITLETSGGLAPVPVAERAVSVDTATVAPERARQLVDLVDQAKFFERAALAATPAAGAADFRSYTLTVEDGARVHTIRLTDLIADPALGQLVSEVRSLGRPSQ